MTSTNVATSALPTPRIPQQVIYLPSAPDLHRRPAGLHAVPTEQLLDEDAWWEAESTAVWTPRRPPEQHGRRCACGCHPVQQRTEAAS